MWIEFFDRSLLCLDRSSNRYNQQLFHSKTEYLKTRRGKAAQIGLKSLKLSNGIFKS